METRDTGHEATITGLAFSSVDPTRLFSGSRDWTVRLVFASRVAVLYSRLVFASCILAASRMALSVVRMALSVVTHAVECCAHAVECCASTVTAPFASVPLRSGFRVWDLACRCV